MYLCQILPSWFTLTPSEWAKRKDGYSRDRPPIVPSVGVRVVAAAISTFAGGAFILLPIVFMCYSPSLEKSLATVSVSVLAFGFTIDAFVARFSSETLIATATYAAVLIVFVASTRFPNG
jgi:VIT1/CCC1 family predicted Fe2+/Mn2+ transporter